MRPHWLTIVVALACVAGLAFAAFSTFDFVAHLDRQVHGIHCSFVPGLEETDATGASGCHVTLMSPYSSVLRHTVWGGVPVSLPAMSVFAFLAFWAVLLVLRRRQEDPAATGFLVAATALPVVTSIAMGYLSIVTLDAVCKLCIGIYAASGVSFIGAVGLFIRARKMANRPPDEPQGRPAPMRWGALAGAFGIGIAFVMLPLGAYAAAAPDFSGYLGACGELVTEPPDDDVLVPIGSQTRAVEVLEILDPLCPSCAGFERRFDALPAAERVRRRVLLFPLDSECNWMVHDAIHPGACAISEAVLCAEGDAEEVLDWAFDNQEAIRRAAADDPDAAKRMAVDRFPALSDCIGRPAVQARLNRALRYAVDNQMPVLTPQVYVDGVRMCDEDTDLGMDYALSELVARAEVRGPGQPRATTAAEDEEAERAPSAAAAAASARPTIELRPGTEGPAAGSDEPPLDEEAAQEGEASDAGVAGGEQPVEQTDVGDGPGENAEPAESGEDEASPDPGAGESGPGPAAAPSEPPPAADEGGEL